MPDAKAPVPLDGKTTLDDKVSFSPLRLCYESALSIAGKIVRPLADRIRDRVVVVAGTSLLADVANLRSAYLALDGLTQEYLGIARRAQPAAAPPTPQAGFELFSGLVGGGAVGAVAGALGAATAALAPVGPLVTAAVGALSLLREDVDYRGVSTSVDRLAFEIAVAASLKSQGAAQALVPDLMSLPPTALPAGAAAQSLRGRLAATEKAKAAAAAAVAELVSRQSSLETQLDRADQRFSELQAQWTRTGADPGAAAGSGAAVGSGAAMGSGELTLAARLLRAEAIVALEPLVLHCAVVAAGGHAKVSRSLFRTLFTGDGLTFSGGVIVRWALLAPNGAVEAGGIESSQQTSYD